MTDIVEAWLWAPPSAEMVDRMRGVAARRGAKLKIVPVAKPTKRDAYYTAARRLHWKKIMREIHAR